MNITPTTPATVIRVTTDVKMTIDIEGRIVEFYGSIVNGKIFPEYIYWNRYIPESKYLNALPNLSEVLTTVAALMQNSVLNEANNGN